MSAFEQWVAFLTILRKEVRRYLRIWTQTLLPSAITMSLYFLIFGTLIGKRIGTMGGVSYMEFVVPGLIMMAIITNSYANVVGSFFGAKFNNSVEELLVSPTPTSDCAAKASNAARVSSFSLVMERKNAALRHPPAFRTKPNELPESIKSSAPPRRNAC